jgi:transcriptional regulator with XRE-family HTH domain
MSLKDWLLDQMHQRNETAREASLAAGLSHGAISRFLNGNRPSAASCGALAAHFGVPKELILQLAGLITLPDSEDRTLRQLAAIVDGLPEEHRAGLVELARAYAQLHQTR